jgi:hypothetical protein
MTFPTQLDGLRSSARLRPHTRAGSFPAPRALRAEAAVRLQLSGRLSSVLAFGRGFRLSPGGGAQRLSRPVCAHRPTAYAATGRAHIDTLYSFGGSPWPIAAGARRMQEASTDPVGERGGSQ